ncbi:putative anthocyanin 6''-O-malonyltransferase [Helianthus annuus]|uniref:Anthocyanin 6''-O-malonyltransferase n=1 Tax=Helianthus annuus TaxID=4232 RepID=A0A251RXZ5_HELAN|nr:putative anthocyanin 6''-O-malonyltransferase [Helianthus annuus]KAJ0437672.1 putative anthocyanin 6''-O-malonyltransferase [Helianthus annuus]KAJ0459990.1 putative anthocyanin 6''-O-malonyltransferase [Helianthus annuus]
MNNMDSVPTLTVLEQSQVSPPPATTCLQSLPLSFFDILWLIFRDPVHTLFFYDLPITKTQFTQTIVPNLKQSLSITLQHFFPFVGKLTIFPTSTRKPEIRYVEGDSVKVTFTECNLDFNDLTGNHPRKCDKFYHLIPLLGCATKFSDGDCITMPVFSVQVTLFPNYGISIGMTNHHSLGDASTRFCFLKAWTSIAQFGSDDWFLANGTLPVYDRLAKYAKLDESYLKYAKVETFNEGYQLPRLSGPSDLVRATFILARTTINGLKQLVSTQLPTLEYVSSFIVACAYIWNCVASIHNDESMLFCFPVNCRSRMDPPVATTYFGNCVMPCMTLARTSILNEKEGFLTAAKLIGENLYKMLTNKDGVVSHLGPIENWLLDDGLPMRFMGVAGTPKLKFYDLDFGFGKPIKHEAISTDYSGSISINACRESNQDLEIGVCLSATDMGVFVRNFNAGLESYI